MATTTRNLLIVTGASRGIGQACAVAFAKHPTLRKNLHVCLIARSIDGLNQTSDWISTESTTTTTTEPSGDLGFVKVSKYAVDLSDLDQLEGRIQTIFQELDEASDLGPLSKAIFVNNAGSVGPLGPSHSTSLSDIRSTIDFNITSSIWLSSYFIQYFSKERNTDKRPHCVVINMSSLCGVEPFKTMGVYCAGKASRDMFHAVMGKEEEDSEHHIKVLNYAPGPVESEMTHNLSESDELDSDVSSFFKTSLVEKTLIQPDVTANRLLDLVMTDNYKNGQHVDFYDLDKPKEEE